jgi:putative transposase
MDAVAASHGLCPVRKACEALALPPRTYYAWKKPPQASGAPQAPAVPKDHPRALTKEQKEHALAVLNSPRFADLSASQAYAQLLDEGTYLGSERTLYRLLAEQGQTTARYQRPHQVSKKPELLATRPNTLWSWDITKLKAAEKWTYFYLYVILDVFSRYVVGWMVAYRESAELAEGLIADTCLKQEIRPGQLTLHADRGSSMTSKAVGELLMDLGVTKSHSRPHVSDDNPFSEAQFKTFKYRPEFPDRFGSIEDSRAICRDLFTWYNTVHRHSGLAHFTPEDVHYGQVECRRRARQETLEKAYAAHPERFVKGAPTAAMPPTEVWINKPKDKEVENPETPTEPSLNENDFLCKID